MADNKSEDLSEFSIKYAAPQDAGLILDFIKLIAEYERLSHEVVATTDDVIKIFFSPQPKAFCVIAFEGNVPVGYAVYFFNFSTFLCKHGLYLEDLFVKPEFRGKGYGKKLLLYLTKVALDNDCGRMEWCVLDWNIPAIEFYKSLQAKPMDEWTIFRLKESELKLLNT